MRTLWILCAIAITAPSLASADAVLPFASASNTCELLDLTPVPPPTACPHVDQVGTATGGACAITTNGTVCDVTVHTTSRAQGLVLGSRDLVSEIVALDGTEPATEVCAVSAPGSQVGCEGEATATLLMNADGCREFRVRTGLRDLGVSGTYLFHIQTDYSFKVCAAGADADVLRN